VNRTLSDLLHDTYGYAPVFDAMSDADIEKLEVGLLLAEVERRIGKDARWDLFQHFRYDPDASPMEPETTNYIGYGVQIDDFGNGYEVISASPYPTPHAALTALLEKLPEASE